MYINLQCKIRKTLCKNIVNNVNCFVKTFVWFIKLNLQLIYIEVIVAYPEIHNNHRNTGRGPNVEILIVNPVVTFSTH